MKAGEDNIPKCQLYFLRLSVLIVEEGSKVLRNLWIEKWKLEYGLDWDDGSNVYDKYDGQSAGLYLFSIERNNKDFKLYLPKIKVGNSLEWDVSLLAALLRNSMAAKKNPLSKSQTNSLRILTEERNQTFGHCSKLSVDEEYYVEKAKLIKNALIQLGSNRTQCNAILLKSFPEMNHNKKLSEEIKQVKNELEQIAKDPRFRLTEWLDNHLPGSNRRKLDKVLNNSSSQDDSRLLTLTRIDEGVIPTIQLAIKPEDILMPLMYAHVTLIVGSRRQIEYEIED